jgi:hypothetical protein
MVKSASNAVSPIMDSPYNAMIGAYWNNTYPIQFFDGSVDEARIYNTALTASQIQSQYYVGLNKLLAKGLIDETEYQQRLAVK